MQCPNCGRNIRSKHQCAYCGAQFDETGKVIGESTSPELSSNSSDFQVEDEPVVVNDLYDTTSQETVYATATAAEEEELEPAYEEVVIPATKKKRGSGILGILWGLIQIALVLALVFLAFFFGPDLLDKAMTYFRGEEVTKVIETTVTTVASESEVASESQAAANKTAKTAVSTSAYPLMGVQLDFEEGLSDIQHDTFQFKVDQAGQTMPVTDYSVNRQGNTLVFKFVDPTYTAGQAAGKKTIQVSAPALSYTTSAEFDAPASQADVTQVKAIESAIQDSFGTQATQLSQVVGIDGKTPQIIINNKQVAAANEIAWFVLQRTYEAIDQHALNLTDSVTIDQALIAENDTGTTATLGSGATTTIEALINAVIQTDDITAINHLIQAVGGANEFNTWLDAHDYIATRVESVLTIDVKGNISGARTSALDLANLLTRLSQNQLNSQASDEQFKAALLGTPATDKFSPELTIDKRRFEITSPNAQGSAQHYAGIIETETATYVVVILTENQTDLPMANANISSLISRSLATLVGPDTEISATETTTVAQVTEATSAARQDPNVQPAPVLDWFDDNGDGVAETQRYGRWYYDNADGQWKYY